MNEFMKASLDYIEQNLKTEITAEELAQMSGYSVWHYYKLFSRITGSSVLGYILKRRLDRALAEISEGRKAIDVIFEYGFDTYAGFYKAFVKIYGVSPKKYLSIYGEHKSKNLGGNYMINRKEFTEGELRRVLANWDIPQDLPLKKRSVRAMDGTTMAETEWKVGDKYILTTDERGCMVKHRRIQKALDCHGFTGTEPIKTKSGEEYVDGADMFVLTPSATGEPLFSQIDRFDGKYGGFGFKYGQAIAKIHNAIIETEADNMPEDGNLYEFADSLISHVIEGNAQFDIGLPEDFFKDYKETFGALFPKLPKQLICNNTHPCNILFDNGEASGYEFIRGGCEHCGERNTRLYDLCQCANDILGEMSGWWNRTKYYAGDDIYDKWLEIFSGIVRGYDSVNKLTAEEKQAVYYVMCSFKIFDLSIPGDKISGWGWHKTACGNLRYIVENKDKIGNIL